MPGAFRWILIICFLFFLHGCRNQDAPNPAAPAPSWVSKEQGKADFDTAMEKLRMYQKLGHLDKAIGEARNLLELVRDGGGAEQSAMAYSVAGDIYLSTGRRNEAFRYAYLAEDKAVSAKNPKLLAAVLNNIGNIHAAQKHDADAIYAYNEALSLLAGILKNEPESIHAKHLALTVHMNMARVYITVKNMLSLDEEKTLDHHLEKAGSLLNALPEEEETAKNRIALSNLIFARIKDRGFSKAVEPECREAILLLESAARYYEKKDDAYGLSASHGFWGRIYLFSNNLEKAESHTQKALMYGLSGDFPELQYRWHWHMGQILRLRNQTDAAVSAYERAVSVLTPIRTRLFMGYREQDATFRDRVKPVYLELVELYFAQAAKLSSTLEKEKSLLQAKEVLEKLKTIELEEYFQDECVVPVQENVMNIQDIDPDTALYYPVPCRDALHLLVFIRGKPFHAKVDIPESRLSVFVESFRRKLMAYGNNLYLEEAKTLYTSLIRPVKTRLEEAGVTTLVVSPQGILRLIPFSSLHSGEGFLVEELAVATIPALGVTNREEEMQPDQHEALLQGLSEARQGFTPLPSVKNELTAIRSILQKGRMEGDILMDKDFTMDQVENRFSENRPVIVHMATHGVFGRDPEDTFLLTHDGRLTMDQLESLIRITRSRGLSVNLLTLSACQTAMGDERAAFGLAGVAVKAGVKTAVATLWFVDDQAAAAAMKGFYENLLLREMPKAMALQAAQQKMLAEEQFAHPAFWAPFLLIGNWR